MRHTHGWFGGGTGPLIPAATVAGLLFVCIAHAAPGAHGPDGEHLDAPGPAANPSGLAIGVGDLVRVRLQGRPHTGLVVATAAVAGGGGFEHGVHAWSGRAL